MRGKGDVAHEVGDESSRRIGVRLGDGSEVQVEKKRRRRSSPKEETSSEAQLTPPPKKQTRTTKSIVIPVVNVHIPVKYLSVQSLAVPTILAFLTFKKLTTGSWFAWGMQSFDNPTARRNVVQGDEELAQLDMLRCENCGYTIFPALGRTNRFERYVNECNSCGAIGSFYNRNDPDDPRNLNPDGTSTVDERRSYMKGWIAADASQAKKLMKEYTDETGRLAAQGSLPKGLAQEISEKQKEIKADLEEALSEKSKEQGGEVKEPADEATDRITEEPALGKGETPASNEMIDEVQSMSTDTDSEVDTEKLEDNKGDDAFDLSQPARQRGDNKSAAGEEEDEGKEPKSDTENNPEKNDSGNKTGKPRESNDDGLDLLGL